MNQFDADGSVLFPSLFSLHVINLHIFSFTTKPAAVAVVEQKEEEEKAVLNEAAALLLHATPRKIFWLSQRCRTHERSARRRLIDQAEAPRAVVVAFVVRLLELWLLRAAAEGGEEAS